MPSPTIQRHDTTIHCFTEPLGQQINLQMALISGGSFEMGSPADELDRRESEDPQHTVTVPTFFMGRTPITQAQWRQAAAFPAVGQSLTLNPSRFKGDNLPVEQVSWHNAVEFCLRLSQRTGRDYRLPSEAEWEYACRAGSKTPFHFGETIDAALANYNAKSEAAGKYGRGKLGEYRQTTTPVDLFSPNLFGLYDMHGNVWEWCQDHWHDSYKDAPIDGSAWLNPKAKEDAHRILRGGSWLYNPQDCRSAFRNHYAPGSRRDSIGFRVVCAAPRILL